MPFKLTMPKLSPTMEEGMIAKWHKKVGDKIAVDEMILEVATDKATVEYNALDEGYLRAILVKEGQNAQVNEPIAILAESMEEAISDLLAKAVKPSVTPLPKENIAEASETVPAKAAPMNQAAFVPEAPLAHYELNELKEHPNGRILASPLARKLASEQGLDLKSVKGTGPNQRIMKRDLEHAKKVGAFSFGSREAPTIAPGTYEEESLVPMRKVIAARLQESKSFIPHFYVQLTVDIEPLIALREQLKHVQAKVSINDLLIRASALALKKHPNVNSGFNSVNSTMIRFKTIDISVAVSTGEGLITPIIRHADYKNAGEISAEMKELVKRAKEGKLAPHEYKGGSFTISNLGMYGVTNFQAIINPPQAAILAVSGILDTPVIKNGQVVPGKIMNLTLSADHRVVDGVAAAEFLNTLKTYIENPAALLL